MGCVLAVAWTLFLLFLAHIALTQADVRQPRTRLSVLSSPAYARFRLARMHVSGKDWPVLGQFRRVLPSCALFGTALRLRQSTYLFLVLFS